MSEIGAAQVTRRSGPSIVWLVPLITALVGGWLIFRTLSDQAPVATISFQTAEGIEAGKTKIRYKSVEIGIVEEVSFAEDFENVILTARFNEGMDNFLRRNTRFWVVRPQLSVQGVSGLSTLVSGSYIEIDPGPGSAQNHFVGLEQMPLITTEDAGTRITLASESLNSIARGSPIYYQGILAGEALGYELASDARSVYIHAFIRDPYDQLVRGNSRFWNASGLDVSMGADGIEVRTASIQSLMFGGIAFETPDTLEVTSADIKDLIFTLHGSYDEIQERGYVRKLPFVMYFTGSVRGLNPGAPVEFKGIRIGEVLDIRLEFDSEDTSFRIPVLVELEPDRIIDRDQDASVSPEQTLARLVDKGLRARLQTGSLLTGQLFVELNLYPGSPLNYVADADVPYPELPTIVGAFEAISQSITAFVSKLEEIDINAMGDNIVGILEGTNELVNKPTHEATVTDLQASFRSFREILDNVEKTELDDVMTSANTVLKNLDQTLLMVNEVLKPNAPLQYNVIKVTDELEETARAIRSLVETLQRRPNSLIFGRGSADGEEPEETSR
ncbi:MAG: MlaD family protein [Proteobacteria bacterium]|jgi:paraquat-inducible protein B|nr:MlaD family protein [Pseudomonadota bacterium]MDA1300683.1 MlaD family protein [Pseudomonadota bacterium]